MKNLLVALVTLSVAFWGFWGALLPGDSMWYRGGDAVIRSLTHVPAGDRCIARVCADGGCAYYTIDPGHPWVEEPNRPRMDCVVAGGYTILYVESATMLVMNLTFLPDISTGNAMSEGD